MRISPARNRAANATTAAARAVALRAEGLVLPAVIGIAGHVAMIVAARVHQGPVAAVASPVVSAGRAGSMMNAAGVIFAISVQPSHRRRACPW